MTPAMSGRRAWSFAAADVSPAATRVEVIAEDIKGNESKRVVVSR